LTKFKKIEVEVAIDFYKIKNQIIND